MEAMTTGNMARRIKVLTHPELLVVDEIGYLPVDQEGAILFFQRINARHERASTVLTSNKGFEDWGSVLGDEVMAAALIDRLLHHCHIVNIRGNSYRMRAHQDLLRVGADEDQIATQSQLRREHTTERQGTFPEVCNFQLLKTCNFRLTLTYAAPSSSL